MRFVPSNIGEGVDAVCGEEFEGGDAAQVAPVVAVGGGSKGGVIVEDVFAGEEAGPVGEGDVVFGEAVLEEGVGGDDDDEA